MNDASYLAGYSTNDQCIDGDVHLVPGDGKTDWEEFFYLKERYAPEATVLCEVRGIAEAKRSVFFLKKLYQM